MFFEDLINSRGKLLIDFVKIYGKLGCSFTYIEIFLILLCSSVFLNGILPLSVFEKKKDGTVSGSSLSHSFLDVSLFFSLRY